MVPESLYFSRQLNITYIGLGGNGKIAARGFEEGHVSGHNHPPCKWRTSEKPAIDCCVKSQPHGLPNSQSGRLVRLPAFRANEKSFHG
jgi:hypothetical protein